MTDNEIKALETWDRPYRSTTIDGSRPAVSYRVGSLGELRSIPPEGLDSAELYELRTITGVEWYASDGNRTDSPPFADE